MDEDEYQAFIGAQAAGADAYVERRLDQLCMDLGYRRDQWRTWKYEDILKSFKARPITFKFDGEHFRKRMKAVQEALTKGRVFIP